METVSTFLFADIAGYSALTEAHGDELAADLAGEFSDAVSEAAPRSAQVVKTIGDAVMLRLADPAEAVQLAVRIPYEVWTGHGLPAAAVGLHHGLAVERGDDWFGSTVNVASRLAGLAAGGEVLVTEVVKESAGGLRGIRFDRLGEQELRNMPAPVAIFAARPAQRSSLPDQVDPVCRMMVAQGREARVQEHDGVEYRFCSSECADRFASDPQAHLRHLRGE
jgi:class 3 adenylate cyclase/YHS domain-containing protein